MSRRPTSLDRRKSDTEPPRVCLSGQGNALVGSEKVGETRKICGETPHPERN